MRGEIFFITFQRPKGVKFQSGASDADIILHRFVWIRASPSKLWSIRFAYKTGGSALALE
jgi:hypothetical protein